MDHAYFVHLINLHILSSMLNIFLRKKKGRREGEEEGRKGGREEWRKGGRKKTYV